MSTSARPSLPTSSSDFALPPSSSSFAPHALPAEVPISPFLTLRSRRPTTLSAGKLAFFSEGRIQSPLTSSYLPRTRDSSGSRPGEESESDRERERMNTDSPTPPSGGSQNNTPPPLGPPVEVEARMQRRKRRHHARSRSPSTPPRNGAVGAMDILDPPPPRLHMRRLSYPIKPPRILTLLQESRPEENELKSEAQFQRILASTSAHPFNQLQPRAPSDRGRYPEEAGDDDIQRADTPSDGEGDGQLFTYTTEPVAISKPTTPSPSLCGEDMAMIVPESPGGAGMDVDMQFGSPSLSSTVGPSWRHTPPPTSSAVRSNKRKYADDRYDPYPTSKRRAVSPSVSHLRDPRTPTSSRGPVAIAIPSGLASGMPSPTVGFASAYAYPPVPRTASSPTMRNAMILASPILRPTGRLARREEEDEREVDGAGYAVGGLTLC